MQLGRAGAAKYLEAILTVQEVKQSTKRQQGRAELGNE